MFISVLLFVGVKVKSDGGIVEDILVMLFGLIIVGVFVEILFSFFIMCLKCIIILLIMGIVIIFIGLLLINVGMIDLVGGFNVESFGSLLNLGIGVVVLLVIVFLNVLVNYWLCLLVIFIGMIIGILYVVLI